MGKLVKSTVSCVILRVSWLTCFLNNVLNKERCANDAHICFDINLDNRFKFMFAPMASLCV